MSDEQQNHLRKEAHARLKARRNFKQTFGGFVIVWLILTAIWALSGQGYYWPIWAIFGMCIALAFMAWGAYGPPDTISDAEIDAEMRKMSGQE